MTALEHVLLAALLLSVMFFGLAEMRHYVTVRVSMRPFGGSDV